MITKEIAENLYDLVTTKSFGDFLSFLVKLKLDLLSSMVNLKDDKDSILTAKRIQGQAQMIDFIIMSFSKQNFDKILEKNKNSNIGNTV